MESAAPQPVEGLPRGRGVRVVAALGTVLLFVMTLIVGVGVGSGAVAWWQGRSVSGVADELADGKGTAAVFGSLLIGQMLVAAALLLMAHTGPGLRRLGWTWAGTRRALRLTAPITIFVAGAPVLIEGSSGGHVVHPDLGVTEILLIIGLSVAVGVSEEIAFRGLVMFNLGGASTVPLTVVGSATLFGVPHIGNGGWLNPLSVTLAVGIPFALVRLRGGSVIGLAAAHALIDIVAFLQIGSIELPTDTPPSSDYAQAGFHAVVAALYVGWFIHSGRSPGDEHRAPPQQMSA